MTRFEGAGLNGSEELDYEQTLEAREDDSAVETLFVHVGSRRSGFVVTPDEFVRGFCRSGGQFVVHVGRGAISVLVGGELGSALER